MNEKIEREKREDDVNIFRIKKLWKVGRHDEKANDLSRNRCIGRDKKIYRL